MCWASRAALCNAPASSRAACSCAVCATSQPPPEEDPESWLVMEQSSVLNTLTQDGAGCPGSFSQSPENESCRVPSVSRMYLSV